MTMDGPWSRGTRSPPEGQHRTVAGLRGDGQWARRDRPDSGFGPATWPMPGRATTALRSSCHDSIDLRQVGPRDDRRPERAQALDGQDDLVAGLELAAERRVLDLEQAARPDRPAAEQVARAQVHVGRGPREHLRRTRTARRTSGRATRLGAVRPSAVIARSGPVAPARGVGQLVRGHEPRPDRRREVLALGRPEPDGRLLALQVARRPVVEDRVAADRLLGRAPRGRSKAGVSTSAATSSS